jgi:hypothetical protein
MALAPMDMLRKCRAQFDRYAQEHRAKEAAGIEGAGAKARTNEILVAEIDATLQQWG